MPKTKTHSHGSASSADHYHVKHKSSKAMDKVKIKRVKRTKKKPTTKEKVLAGLGVGSSLLGGVGAVAPKEAQTEFVREQPAETGSSRNTVKDTIKRIFGSAFGAPKAKADSLSDALAQAQAGVDAAASAYNDAQYSGDYGAMASAQAALQAAQDYYNQVYNQVAANQQSAQQQAAAPSGGTMEEQRAAWDAAWSSWDEQTRQANMGAAVNFNQSWDSYQAEQQAAAAQAAQDAANAQAAAEAAAQQAAAQAAQDAANAKAAADAAAAKAVAAAAAARAGDDAARQAAAAAAAQAAIDAAAAKAAADAAAAQAVADAAAARGRDNTTNVQAGTLTASGASGNVSAGDPWSININGATPGAIVYAVGGKGGATDKTPMGVVGADGTFHMNGTYSAGDAGNWGMQWLVGDKVSQNGSVNFNLQAPASANGQNTATPAITGLQGYNAANQTYNTSVDPNQYLVIYGNFATDGTNKVMINGQLATITYQSPTSINVQLGNIAPGAPINVVVTNNNGTSQSQTIPTSGTPVWTEKTPPPITINGSVSTSINNSLTANVSINGKASNLSILPDGRIFDDRGNDITTDLVKLGVDATVLFAQLQSSYNAAHPTTTTGGSTQAGSTTFSTSSSDPNNVKAGDTWTINIHDATPGAIVYAVGGKGGATDKTPMGVVGADGTFVMNGTFSSADAGSWGMQWLVGDKASQNGNVNFNLQAVAGNTGNQVSIVGNITPDLNNSFSANVNINGQVQYLDIIPSYTSGDRIFDWNGQDITQQLKDQGLYTAIISAFYSALSAGSGSTSTNTGSTILPASFSLTDPIARTVGLSTTGPVLAQGDIPVQMLVLGDSLYQWQDGKFVKVAQGQNASNLIQTDTSGAGWYQVGGGPLGGTVGNVFIKTGIGMAKDIGITAVTYGAVAALTGGTFSAGAAMGLAAGLTPASLGLSAAIGGAIAGIQALLNKGQDKVRDTKRIEDADQYFKQVQAAYYSVTPNSPEEAKALHDAAIAAIQGIFDSIPFERQQSRTSQQYWLQMGYLDGINQNLALWDQQFQKSAADLTVYQGTDGIRVAGVGTWGIVRVSADGKLLSWEIGDSGTVPPPSLIAAIMNATHVIKTNDTPPPPAANVKPGTATFNTGSGNTQNIKAGDTWNINITGATPGATVYAVGGKGGATDKTPVGTVGADGTFKLNGVFSAGDAGAWKETWMVGDKVAENGNFNFNLQAPAAPAPTVNAGSVNLYTSSGDPNNVKAGDAWSITITGATPGAPVYAVGGKGGATDKTPMGVVGADGTFKASGVFSAGDAGAWKETWMVGDQVSKGNINFNLTGTVIASTSQVNLDLGADNQYWSFGPFHDWAHDHPDKLKGTVTVNKDAQGNIVSYVIAGSTFSATQLASAITDIGKQMYGKSVNDGLNSLNAHDLSVYLLGTESLTLPGTPYYFLPPVIGAGPNQSSLIFTAPGTATTTLNGKVTGGMSNLTWIMPAQAQAVLADIQKTHPDAKLVDAINFAGFGVDYGSDPRRSYNVIYTDPSTGKQVQVDAYQYLYQMPGNQPFSGTTVKAGALTFTSSADDINSLQAGDTWTIFIKGSTPNSPVYLQGGQDGAKNRTQMGITDANGNFTMSGAFTPSQVGLWTEAWSVGDTFVTNLNLNVQKADPGTVNNPAVFLNVNGAATSGTVIIGDKWTINIAGAAPYTKVYAIGGKVVDGVKATDKTLMGQTDGYGNFTLSGTYSEKDKGNWTETWVVGDQTIGDVNFKLDPIAAAASTAKVNMDLGAPNQYWDFGPFHDWAHDHPDKLKGTVTVNKDTAGNIISYVFADGSTYTATQLASAITDIGTKMYGKSVNDALNSLNAHDLAVYLLGTSALTLPGTPYYYLPPVIGVGPNQSSLMFTPPGTAETALNGKTTGGISSSTWVTPAQANAALAQIQKYYPGAKLYNTYSNFAGFDVNFGSDPRRPYVIIYTDANGNTGQIDAKTVLFQMGTSGVLTKDPTADIPTATGGAPQYMQPYLQTTANNAPQSVGGQDPDWKLINTPVIPGNTSGLGTGTGATQTTGTVLSLSASTLNLTVGSSTTVTATVTTNGAVNHRVNAVFSSNSVLTNVNQTTGVITVIGLAPGTARITLHPADLADSNTSQDKVVTVNVTAAAARTTTQTTDQQILVTDNSVAGSVVALSANIIQLTAGNSATVKESVATGSTTSFNVTVNSSDRNIATAQVNTTTGDITIRGVSSGSAIITVHPTSAGSNLTFDRSILVIVSPVAVTVTSDVNSGNTVQTGNTTSNTGTQTGTAVTTTLVNSDQQLVQQLRDQISGLQSRIDVLTGQLNSRPASSGSTVVVQQADTSALQNQVTGLRTQVSQLSSLVSQLQSGQIRILGTTDQVQGLQMPAGYGTGQTNLSGGLQMPPGYGASGQSNPGSGLQMPPGYPASEGGSGSAQVQGSEALGTYTVKKGDSLWNIARKYYGDGTKWRKILSANPNCLSQPGNVKTLKIGAVLTIPNLSVK